MQLDNNDQVENREIACCLGWSVLQPAVFYSIRNTLSLQCESWPGSFMTKIVLLADSCWPAWRLHHNTEGWSCYWIIIRAWAPRGQGMKGLTGSQPFWILMAIFGMFNTPCSLTNSFYRLHPIQFKSVKDNLNKSRMKRYQKICWSLKFLLTPLYIIQSTPNSTSWMTILPQTHLQHHLLVTGIDIFYILISSSWMLNQINLKFGLEILGTLVKHSG